MQKFLKTFKERKQLQGYKMHELILEAQDFFEIRK